MESLLAERYRLDRIAGHGGMAVVYEAFDTVLERRVAIKYFQTHLMHEPILVERFRREALAAAKIDHVNVVAIHDIGENEDGRPFIIMEYIDGPTVAQLLAEGPIPAPRAVGLAAGVAHGLGAAHALGFIHRDVKPANILVAAGELAKLTDFGLVRSDGTRAPDGPAARLTAAGTFVGSVRFVAPEQISEGLSTTATDCYALGATLAQMLTGEVPAPGDGLWPGADEGLEVVVRGLLEADPAVRWADAESVAVALDAVALRLSSPA